MTWSSVCLFLIKDLAMKRIFSVTLLVVTLTLLMTMCSAPNQENKKQGGTLVVANKSGNNISFIDRSTGKILKTLPTGEEPHEVEISYNGKFAVVSNYGDREEPGNTLSVYDVKQAKLLKTIDLGENTRPHGLKWLKGTNKLLVTTEGTDRLLLVDVDTGTIEREMVTGQPVSHMVAATPNGKYAFVSSIRTGDVTVFELKTGEMITQIHSGDGAEGIAVSPNGKELWVTNRGENTLSVFDVSTFDLLNKVPCGEFPIRAKFSPSGKHFVVSNARSGEIAVFDTREKKMLNKIKLTPPVPEDKDPERYFSEFEGTSVPIGLVVPDDNTVYVANTRSDAISVFDLSAQKVKEHFMAGKEPDGIGYSPIEPDL